MRRLSALCSLALLVGGAALAGCGEAEVAAGARVAVYVAAPLCREAGLVLREAGGEAGGLGVRATCLPPVEKGGHADLAAAGAAARRASEDSTAVAYLEAPGPGAKFGRSILESAEIAWLETRSGSTAMRQVLRALEKRGSSSPRTAVRESFAND